MEEQNSKQSQSDEAQLQKALSSLQVSGDRSNPQIDFGI
jgi:hypothetical protein